MLTDELATRHGVYMVRFRDTYGKIADRLGISPRDIRRLNPDVDYPRGVFVTQVLRIR
jgi:LysM repeat protein